LVEHELPKSNYENKDDLFQFPKNKPPNIVVFMVHHADDTALNLQSEGCSLSGMAEKGIILNSYYPSPYSAPFSRASFLYGFNVVPDFQRHQKIPIIIGYRLYNYYDIYR